MPCCVQAKLSEMVRHAAPASIDCELLPDFSAVSDLIGRLQLSMYQSSGEMLVFTDFKLFCRTFPVHTTLLHAKFFVHLFITVWNG